MAKRRKRTTSDIPAKGRLRDIADKLWSRAVRDDWDNRCAVCGSGKCEAHHLIPRQHEATRYSLNNGIALCASHHQFDPDISPHQNAAGWMRWLREHYPEVAVWYEANVSVKPQFLGTKNTAYYLAIIRYLRQYVSPDDFERIVGVRFTTWLDTNS